MVEEKLMRFQALTAESIKVIAPWNTARCSLAEVHLCLRGAYCLHHQGYESLTDLMMERKYHV
jgi:hypothetical protein